MMKKHFKTFVVLCTFGLVGCYKLPQIEYIELNHRIIPGDLSYIWDVRELGWPPPPVTVSSIEQLQEFILIPAYNYDGRFTPFSFVEDVFAYYDEDFFEDYYIIFFPVVGDRRFISFGGVTVDGDIIFNHSDISGVFTADFQSFMLILEISQEFYFD